MTGKPKRRVTRRSIIKADVDKALAMLSVTDDPIPKRVERCSLWLKRIGNRDPARALEVFFGLLKRVVPRAKPEPRIVIVDRTRD